LADVIWGEEIATDIVVATGKIFQQIVNEAKEVNADLIIIGRHQTNASSRLFHRSTTERVVCSARCPVLVMHAFDHGFVRDAHPVPCSDR
jgi:nucleotide-binding universal stress UspA family protein